MVIKDVAQRYTFHIVDKIPSGYSVWNVSFKSLFGDTVLVPLVKEDKGYHVDVDSMKALVVQPSDLQVIQDATPYFSTIKSAKSYIKRYGKSENPSAMTVRKLKKAQAFVDALSKYTRKS